MAALKVGVLVSGSGSNLQTLIDLCTSSDIPAEIVCVISNKPDVFALVRAAKAGIAARIVRHQDFADRVAFEQAIERQLAEAGVDFICLAGFMRILTPDFTERWRDRMLNIHPSLLPSFTGLHTHRRAIEAGVRFHGCTVHFVRPELDNGPIVVQAAVPVLASDTEETLAARVLKAEHRAYPAALRLIAEGRVTVEGNRTVIAGNGEIDETGLLNPSA